MFKRIIYLSIATFFFVSIFTRPVLAVSYGEGVYGEGNYNEGDVTAPVISSVVATPTTTGATITWTTDEVASSQVEYGTTNSYGTQTTEADTGTRVTSHTVTLSGLSSCTTYHYRVLSTDAVSNQGTGSDGTFKTTGCSSSGSSSSSSNSSSSSFHCDNTAPTYAPNLYSAVPQDSTSILLTFTGAGDPVEHYALEFGRESGKYIWGATTIGDKNIRSYLVKSLSPNTTYYFRVRGGNGCATGDWSQEIAATTKGYVSTKNLNIVSLELTPVQETQTETVNPSCKTHTVQSGDTLWSIAQDVLGDGSNYQEIIDQNKITYPSLETSNALHTGWELKVNCTGQPNQPSETITKGGYDVHVKVVDTNKKPVAGAKVTLHSAPKEATTDKDGIATFTNVEAGQHKVLIAYDGYQGEQSINLTGDVKQFDLNVTVQKQSVLLSPTVLVLLGISGLIIVVLSVLLVRARRK